MSKLKYKHTNEQTNERKSENYIAPNTSFVRGVNIENNCFLKTPTAPIICVNKSFESDYSAIFKIKLKQVFLHIPIKF